MACFHPLKAFRIGTNPETGKAVNKVVPYGTDHLELIKGTWIPVSGPNVSVLADRIVRDSLDIPCGKCVGCRLEYSRQWANRCMLELQYHKSAYFLTLTYADEFVPVSYFGDPETGEAQPVLSLRKRDLQLFFKRLRKRFPDSLIRYYACGEYGETTMRPHYHAIVYGLQLDDLVVNRRTKTGHILYNSQVLSDVWCLIGNTGRAVLDREGKRISLGFVGVAEVTWESCAYTARYVMKKHIGDDSIFYELHNIEPEFVLMSRRPGIGRQYYDDHPDMFHYDKISISTPKGGRSFYPPKYYERLYDIDFPDHMAEIKQARRNFAKARAEFIKTQHDLLPEEYFAVQEDSLRARIKSLIREL